MKKLLLLLILSFGINSCSLEQKDNNTLTTINIFGSLVYEKPSFDSKKNSILPAGEKIKFEKTIQIEDSLRLYPDFSLKGKWIKLKDEKGFIFNSEVTKKKIKINEYENGYISINFLGELKNIKEETKEIKTNNGSYPEYSSFSKYENGNIKTIESDGCNTQYTEYNQLSINELYYQLLSEYGRNQEINKRWYIPKYDKKNDAYIFYIEFEASEVIVKFNSKNKVLETHSSCD